MKNNEIEQLIRMTREIEDLEASAGTARGRGGGFGGVNEEDSFGRDGGVGAFSFAAAKERELAKAAVERARVRSATWWRHAFTAAAVVVLGGIALNTVMPLVGRGGGGSGGSGGRPVAIAPKIDVPAIAKEGEMGRGSVGKLEPKLALSPRPPFEPKPPFVPSRTGDETMSVRLVSNADGFVHTGCDEGGSELKGAPQEMASRIIAFSLDSESHCACSQTVLHAWAGDRGVSEVTRAELLELGFETSCITTPDRIMVVAVSGPVNELPITDEQVVELARCVDLNPSDDGLIDYLGHDEGKYAAAAMSCLASGLQVEVVTLLAR